MHSEEERKFDHTGTIFDRFLQEEGILDEVEADALERVVTRQLSQVEQAAGR